MKKGGILLLSNEKANFVLLSCGLVATLSFLALYSDYHSGTVASEGLREQIERDTQSNVVSRHAGVLATERVFNAHASRSDDMLALAAQGPTTPSTAATTTSTVTPTPLVKSPPTTQANTAPAYPVGCELYLPLVQSYDWPVDQAMLTMSVESGCNPNKVSRTNDYGLFQLHDEPVFDPEANVRRGYEKWAAGRVGDHNFSAWYAVCDRRTLQPKYPGIVCQ
jgi:hypothetical protein